MPDSALDVDALLKPLAGATPSGDDLGYDPQFVAMEQAGAGKPETQYGDKVFAAEPPDWNAVYEQALAIAQRTRDLRVAVWLLRSSARMHGLGGVEQTLRLVHGLLDGFWDSVHPQLDASDDNDPTMRLNALAPLVSPEAALADLRAASIAPVRGSLSVRDLELGLGLGMAAAGEAVPTEAGVLQALQDLLAKHPQVADVAASARRSADAVAALLVERVGHDRAPDLGPLAGLLKALVGAIARAQGVEESAAGVEGSAPAAGGAAAAGSIRTRADAVRELERVCDWLERNEPSNPAPLLIRRAQRLMNKNFLEIVRDLAPEGVTQIELIAGSQAQT
jgi:type VI secretion system protein ImpA